MFIKKEQSVPKILDVSKEKILLVAGGILKKDGYRKLSVREVARVCGMATGTFYRYFPSKDYLVAEIIARDWAATYGKMREVAKTAKTFEEGFMTFFRLTDAFSARFEKVFKEYSVTVGSHETLSSRHCMLREQIADCTKALALNAGQPHLAAVAEMIAECLLSVINQPDLNEKSLDDFIKIMIY